MNSIFESWPRISEDAILERYKKVRLDYINLFMEYGTNYTFVYTTEDSTARNWFKGNGLYTICI